MTQALLMSRLDANQSIAHRRPGLDVSICTAAPSSNDGVPLVRVRVDGARPPFRLYLYVDGQLEEAWIPAAETSEHPCPSLASGRHTITARAVDAGGRWGGASTLLRDRD
jgi:hypothetical protein